MSLASGCSFAVMRGAPAAQCSVASPVADTVLAIAGFVPAIYFASISEIGPENDAGLGLIFIGLPAAVVGAVFGASAAFGYTKHSRCRHNGRGASKPSP